MKTFPIARAGLIVAGLLAAGGPTGLAAGVDSPGSLTETVQRFTDTRSGTQGARVERLNCFFVVFFSHELIPFRINKCTFELRESSQILKILKWSVLRKH